MIDFPPHPILDEEYTDPEGTVWLWNGSNWDRTFSTLILPTLALPKVGDVSVGYPKPTGESYLIYNGDNYIKTTWNYAEPEYRAPFFYYYNTSGMTEPAKLTWTLVPFNQKYSDYYNGYNTGTSEYTIPISGYWVIEVRANFGDIRDRVQTALYKNGTLYTKFNQYQGQSSQTYCYGMTFDHFDEGDVLKIMVEGEWYQFYLHTGIDDTEFSGYLVNAD